MTFSDGLFSAVRILYHIAVFEHAPSAFGLNNALGIVRTLCVLVMVEAAERFSGLWFVEL